MQTHISANLGRAKFHTRQIGEFHPLKLQHTLYHTAGHVMKILQKASTIQTQSTKPTGHSDRAPKPQNPAGAPQ